MQPTCLAPGNSSHELKAVKKKLSEVYLCCCVNISPFCYLRWVSPSCCLIVSEITTYLAERLPNQCLQAASQRALTILTDNCCSFSNPITCVTFSYALTELCLYTVVVSSFE